MRGLQAVVALVLGLSLAVHGSLDPDRFVLEDKDRIHTDQVFQVRLGAKDHESKRFKGAIFLATHKISLFDLAPFTEEVIKLRFSDLERKLVDE